MQLKRIHKILFALILLFSLGSTGLASDLEVHFINVGQGDAILVIAPNGKKILIDAGGHSGGEDQRNPFDYIKSMEKDGKIGDLYIDFAIITHPHDDHYGGSDIYVSETRRRMTFTSGAFFTVWKIQRLMENFPIACMH